MVTIGSLSSESENIDDDIVVLERILFAEVAIIFAVPEATCTHMEAAVTLLQDNHVSSELKILVNFLQKFDDYFAGIVAPFLRLLRIIIACLKLSKDQVVNLLLYL